MKPISIETSANPPQVNFEMKMHSHSRGQLSYIADGTMRLRINIGRWVVPKGRVVWVPAGIDHEFSVIGRSSSWAAFLPENLSKRLPNEVCVLGVSPLLFASLETLVREKKHAGRTQRIRNLEAVIRDELESAKPEALGLQLPRSVIIRRVVDELLHNPADKRGLEAWARETGVSLRSFTRRFREETGTSFAKWRQVLRLQTSMEMLMAGQSVSDVAFALDYGSVSAFVEAFRKYYGSPPGQLIANR